ncbi:response regulator transcription factor [Caballeronia sp. BR00000012568055]|uniref:response regulator transcription factor n=1 Tax=Caballeronia sp. BR00000012568055 TaxID=2918761 RepID=UPI0023F6CE9F|nr:response regulator transcription factor [Caballeronia sp. BR00000012568055]
MSGKLIRVAILDDHPLAVCGLRGALEAAGCEVIGTATSPNDILELLSRVECDVMVTDYIMPRAGELDGWRFLSAVSMAYPNLPVLVHSESDDPFLIGSLVQRGVAGIVNKREDLSEVVTAVRRLARGGRYSSPVSEAARARFASMPELRRFASLTRWQMEVAGLMLCGMSVCETSRFLNRGKSTISARRVNACKQLGFARDSEFFRFAARLGLRLDRSDVAHKAQYV